MELTIIAVEIKDNGKSCHLVAGRQTRDGYKKHTYIFPASEYVRLGSPPPGAILMSEDIKIITLGADRGETMAHAMRILAYSDNNRAALTRKLLEHGHYKENVEYVVERMVTLGYINERRQLDNLTVAYANKKLWGRRNIAKQLLAKGYNSRDIHDAIDAAVESGDIDFDKIKRRLLRETVGSDADERDVRAILYKYGH